MGPGAFFKTRSGTGVEARLISTTCIQAYYLHSLITSASWLYGTQVTHTEGTTSGNPGVWEEETERGEGGSKGGNHISSF